MGIEPVFTDVRGSLRFSEFTRAKYNLAEGDWFGDLARSGPDGKDLDETFGALGKYRTAATDWHVWNAQWRGRESAAAKAAREDIRSRYGVYSGDASGLRNKIEEKIQRIAEMGFQGGACAPLGESLAMLASNGVYLRDVHLMNIGWHVLTSTNDWTRLVVFDPGHTPAGPAADIEETLISNGREAL